MDALPSVKPARARASFGVTRVDVSGFRSAREVAFSPGPVCALVGEANAGKSNLLAAIRAVLDPTTSPLTAADVAEDGDGEISINVRLADGSEAKLQGTAERNALTGGANAPPTLFLPAEERAGAGTAWKPSGQGEPPGSSSRRSRGRRLRRQERRSPFSRRSSPAARRASPVSCS